MRHTEPALVPLDASNSAVYVVYCLRTSVTLTEKHDMPLQKHSCVSSTLLQIIRVVTIVVLAHAAWHEIWSNIRKVNRPPQALFAEAAQRLCYSA